MAGTEAPAADGRTDVSPSAPMGATPAPEPMSAQPADRAEDVVLEPDPDAAPAEVVVEPVPSPTSTAIMAAPAPRGDTVREAAADPTGWFEQLYVAAARGEAVVPWDRPAPSVLLVEWAAARGVDGAGRRALVVGCGFGRDAEFIAALGYDTVAFDISATAVRTARERHPGSPVDYRTADLLHPPPAWRAAYDLVVEDMNIQALPQDVRPAAIASTAGFVAPGGTLIVVALAPYTDHEPEPGPPWPLTRADIDAFATGDLRTTAVENIPDRTDPTVHRWRAELHLPA